MSTRTCSSACSTHFFLRLKVLNALTFMPKDILSIFLKICLREHKYWSDKTI